MGEQTDLSIMVEYVYYSHISTVSVLFCAYKIIHVSLTLTVDLWLWIESLLPLIIEKICTKFDDPSIMTIQVSSLIYDLVRAMMATSVRAMIVHWLEFRIILILHRKSVCPRMPPTGLQSTAFTAPFSVARLLGFWTYCFAENKHLLGFWIHPVRSSFSCRTRTISCNSGHNSFRVRIFLCT